MKKLASLVVAIGMFCSVQAQNIMNNPTSNHGNKFEQLGTILPTPNEYRTASGAPGPKYWQQRADYNIKAELDEANLKLKGSETVTYEVMDFLRNWLLDHIKNLDQISFLYLKNSGINEL